VPRPVVTALLSRPASALHPSPDSSNRIDSAVLPTSRAGGAGDRPVPRPLTQPDQAARRVCQSSRVALYWCQTTRL